jgi:hypothetical protein
MIAGLGKPEVMDKINGDQVVELYGDALGIDPRLLNDDEEVKAIRSARAQAQAEAQKQAQAADAVKAAGDLGNVATKGGASDLGADVIGMFSGYQNPQSERLGVG